MSPHTLARRLTFTPGHTSMWGREAGWRMRMILSWLRLVRAGKIQRSRRESPMWREGERIRISTVAASYKREVRRDESWADDVSQVRGQRYAWGAEEALQARSNVSSGAAAIIARRRDPSKTRPTTNNTNQQARGSKRRHTGSNSECNDNASKGHNHNQPVADDAGDMGTRRVGDTLLVYNTITFRRLEEQLRTTYYWRREPFGDG